MATSLEELLAEEGFKGRRLGTKARPSFRAEAASLRKTDSPPVPSRHRIKTSRTRSDAAHYIFSGELPRSNSGASSSRARDNLVPREKLVEGAKIESWIRHARRSSNDLQEDRRFRADSLRDSDAGEIVEVGNEEETIKDIYSDRAYNSERSVKSSGGNVEKGRHIERKGKNIKVEKDHGDSHDQNFPGLLGYDDNIRRGMKMAEASYDSSVRGSKNVRNYEEDKRSKSGNVGPSNPKLALDEVAVQAVVSILNGFVKHFLKDEEFRTALRESCFSSLNFNGMEEGSSIETNAKSNFEQAVETVENSAEEAASSKDLKTAALLLSVIAGLNSMDHKDDLPNNRLSSCAHLYLSVIYKLQKKDRVSAKHLLQVFCNTPSLARTVLLPDLWDYLFFPHLSHLKVWYTQESKLVENKPRKITKLKFLEKVYNESLDSGTYQYALYYKDWLTGGVEAPAVPSISVPSMSVQAVSSNHSSAQGSPSATFSPQPMVSKKLYDAVFARAGRPSVSEIEDSGEAYKYDIGASSSDSPAAEIKQTIPNSLEVVTYPEQDLEKESCKDSQDDSFPPDHGHISPSKEDWKLVTVSVAPESDLNAEISSTRPWQEITYDNSMVNASLHIKAHEIILKSLARSVFELQKTEDSGDNTFFAASPPIEPIKMKATNNQEFSEYFDEGSTFESVPQDFICPLSGHLFMEPVTLETGQTFEREAITEWFEQGNKTCPVTGKALQCLTVPLTNFILKRVIDNWKLEHCSLLLDFSSQIIKNCGGGFESTHRDEAAIFIIETLFTSFSSEERMRNARYLISVGGLKFLLRRFSCGTMEERTRVAALLSCCIEADTGCKDQIASQVDKHCLFELLHSGESESSRNAVWLLTELVVCLSRRTEVALLFSALQREQIEGIVHILLKYLRSSPPKYRPLVAVVLLHLDLLVQHRKNNLYRDEAVDAIAVSLQFSLTNIKVRENSCRALLSLGGQFSDCGKSSTESWILKQAGFKNTCESNPREVDSSLDDPLSLEEEVASEEDWLRNIAASLLGGGKKIFLEEISKCLGSEHSGLVSACLTTIAWLSRALPWLSCAGLQLSAFSALISGLKDRLENGELIHHKVLASVSLLNFSKIPVAECRLLLMTIAEDIRVSLRGLVE
ncbi:hypothetical protein Tsubulata_002040, partial [Turnera subulata]